MREAAGVAAGTVTSRALELVPEVKPRLRGWFHVVAAPAAVVAGVPLVALAPAGPARAATLMFVACALVNFGVSAVMHRGRWSPASLRVITRIDHASIFLAMAGTYTAIAVLLVPPEDQRGVLAVIWAGAALGTWFRLTRADAPRWAQVLVHLGLGAVAVLFVEDITAQARPEAIVLLGSAAALYAAGAVIYALQRPNPVPRWLGFHEIFHALTVLAFAALYAALSITVRT